MAEQDLNLKKDESLQSVGNLTESIKSDNSSDPTVSLAEADVAKFEQEDISATKSEYSQSPKTNEKSLNSEKMVDSRKKYSPKSRVTRPKNISKIEQISDHGLRQRAILENAMRKSIVLALIIAIAVAALLHFSVMSLKYYQSRRMDAVSDSRDYNYQFLRLGLKSKEAEQDSSYKSNREKVYERLINNSSLKMSSEDLDAYDEKNNDLSQGAPSGKENDATDTSLQNDSNLSSKNISRSELAKLINNGPVDYDSVKGLFRDEMYGDVRKMLESKDTIQNLEKVDGGYIQVYPYLKLFAAGEYPLLPRSDEADDSYFDNACFIGDSLMSVFVAGASYDADFFARPNMTTINVLDEFSFTNKDGKEGKIRDLLTYKEYDKVYLLLGTNEVVFGSASDFAARYKEIISYIRSQQTKAEIYVMALFPVSAYYEEEGRFPTNGQFCDMNEALLKMCKETGSFFLDYGSYMRGAYGVLPDEAAKDGIHFSLAYVPAWQEYVSTHTWQGALSLIDPSLKVQTKQEVLKVRRDEEQVIPELDENGSVIEPSTVGAENGASSDIDNDDSLQNRDDSDKSKQKIDPRVQEHADRAIRNNEIAIAEDGEKTPSVESLASVYENSFGNEDVDIKERLDSLYADIRENINFNDNMSSIRSKNISNFYGIDMDKIVDGRILRGSGATAEELLILRMDDENSAMDARQILVQYLKKRIDSYRDYVPAELSRLEKANLIRSGKYVYFLVADNSDVLNSIVDKY